MNGIFNIHILIDFFNQLNTSLLYTIYLFNLIGYVHIVVIFTASLSIIKGRIVVPNHKATYEL